MPLLLKNMHSFLPQGTLELRIDTSKENSTYVRLGSMRTELWLTTATSPSLLNSNTPESLNPS